MKAHAHNPHTTTFMLKRDFSLNDMFYLFQHLLYNATVRMLHLSFVESGVEANSNYLSANYAPPTARKLKAKREQQILVTADKMDVTTQVFQPLSILAHNRSIESIDNL
jgi:hypothetical protein